MSNVVSQPLDLESTPVNPDIKLSTSQPLSPSYSTVLNVLETLGDGLNTNVTEELDWTP